MTKKVFILKDIILTEKPLRVILDKRAKNTHKGDFGKVIIRAGSTGMMGAACLCAKAALRTGAGLVTMAVSPQHFPIAQISIPEAMCCMVQETYKKALKSDAVVIGPGIGSDEDNKILIVNLMMEYEGTIVLDADGLNIMGDLLFDSSFPRKAKLIITPHEGEAARLLKCSREDISVARMECATILAANLGAVTVLKGAGTVIANSDGDIYVNTTGNPGMATGGSGDVLSGMIGALCAQGLSPEKSAAFGVYLHGMAGDMAAEEKGEYGMIASDIIEYIPYAIKRVIK